MNIQQMLPVARNPRFLVRAGIVVDDLVIDKVVNRLGASLIAQMLDVANA